MLQNNKISIVPREIGALKSLRGLFLGDNRIVAIPAEVGSLRSLSALGVRLLASHLENLSHLCVFAQLVNNRLQWLPQELGTLSAEIFVSATFFSCLWLLTFFPCAA